MKARIWIDEGFLRDLLQLPKEVEIQGLKFDRYFQQSGLGIAFLTIQHRDIPSGICGRIPRAELLYEQKLGTKKAVILVDGKVIAERLEIT